MNELIKKLPPMLSGDELFSALSIFPPYDESIRHTDITERLIALSDIYRVYLPSSMSIEVYCKLYLSLLHSLRKKNTKLAAQQSYENFKAIQQQSYGGIIGGADSFTVIGTSGIGKSTAISRALSLITANGTVIENQFFKICPCIIVQCPFDSSVKGLLLEIMRNVDEILDSDYYDKAIKAHATTDMLVGSVSQVALNHIGLLIVDEIQNVANSKNGKALVGALTQLINNSGISIGMVGTPESSRFFEQAMQLARRSLGLHYGALEYGDYFKALCQTLWDYQYVKTAVPLSDSVTSWLYEHSAGIVSVVALLIHDAQELSILDGSDKLDLESLNVAYRERLTFLHSYINPPATHGNKTSRPIRKEIAADITVSADCDTDTPVSFLEYSRIAKAQSADIVELISEALPVTEVVI